MSTPTVSIVIPTYNHARFLSTALQSVQEQTYSDWEAIIVNNYSEDDTIEVVARFNDPRIRLVNYRNNGIIAASRNHGIELAQGEFVAFLDSDDTWYPDKLARCLETIALGYDLVCHGENWIKEGSPPRRMFYGPEKRARYPSLLFDGNCLSTSATLVYKSALHRVGAFSEAPEFITAEDYELWLKLAKTGFSFGFVNEVLGEYRIHGGNQSKVALRNMQAELAVLEQHFLEWGGSNRTSRLQMKKRRALAFYGAGRNLQTDGRHQEALRHFWRAWQTYPFITKCYIAALLSFSANLINPGAH